MTSQDWVGTLDALVAGDAAALARTARLVTSRLRSLGAYDLRNEWDDICQEVILALVRARKAGGVDSSGRVLGFVRVTTFNHYCDCLRAHLRRSRPMAEPVGVPDRDQPSSSVPTSLPVELLDLLARIEAESRYALVAHILEGRTFEEIAADLGVSRPTAVRRVAEARAQLRKLYLEAGSGAFHQERSIGDGGGQWPRSAHTSRGERR